MSENTNHTPEVMLARPRPPEFHYLENLIISRLDSYFNHGKEATLPSLPSLDTWELLLPAYLKQQMDAPEATTLLIALAPHIQPDLIDGVIERHLQKSGDFREIGGVRGKNYRGFLPTGETVLFLLAGNDRKQRFEIQRVFDQEHFFAKNQILRLEDAPSGEPSMSGRVVISPEYVELLTQGMISRPRFGINFPAQCLDTLMEWEDLVLPDDTIRQIRDLQIWIEHGEMLNNEWGMGKRLKPGYRVLFHGPPGTGKTLTASLLGKYTARDVYKIDLSMVVSKFIGETEKNLASLFDKAENKGWILFFDEADALFGKRTSVRDAHDKYANQEVSFLLQRTENYNGLVILATNFKSNVDDAFTRRFQSHIYFPPPRYDERLKLWHKAFPAAIKLERSIDLAAIARQYEMTGANIMNVVQYTCLQAMSKKSKVLSKSDLLQGIINELSKEGKAV